MPSYAYADHTEVAEIIRNGQAGKDYLVVDVRDDDFEGGNIKGARNYPSSTFYDKLEDLVEETREVPKVIFHCALSQQRGPKMARIYAEELERRGARVELAFERDAASKESTSGDQSGVGTTISQKQEKEVIVLRGGFTRWQEKYKDDPELVEKWKAAYWASPSY